MGALPAGWHACIDPTHKRPYYFNTVTKQSQWTLPTAAAAIPIGLMPSLAAVPATYSPASMRRAAAGLGGVSDMAASFGLPLSK